MIDTEVKGSPDAIAAPCGWLDDVATMWQAQESNLGNCLSESRQIWTGAGSPDYDQIVTRLIDHASAAAEHATKASEFLAELAAQLKATQDDMALSREAAAEAGLLVEGFIIHPPRPVAPPVETLNPTPREEQRHLNATREYEFYQQQMRAYEIARQAVPRKHEYLASWIAEVYRSKLAALLESADSLHGLLSNAQDFSEALTAHEQRALAERLIKARNSAIDTGPGSTSMDDYLRTVDRQKEQIIDLQTGDVPRSPWLKNTGKALGVFGTGLTVIDAGMQIAHGKSPSLVLGNLTGDVTGDLVGGAIGSIGGPIGSWGLSVVGSDVLSGAGEWATTLLPASARVNLDEWVRDRVDQFVNPPDQGGGGGSW